MPLTHKRKIFDAYKKALIEEMVLNGDNGDQMSDNCEGEWQLWGDKSYFREE